MKWILVPFIAIVAIVIAIALIGLTLPATHVATRKARFKQTPQALFAAISGPGDWRSDVSRIEAQDSVAGRERWKEFDQRGSAILYELVESTPPLRRVTLIADDSLPFGGTWTFDIAPAPGGSTLRITERGVVKNPIFRFVSKFVIGHYRTMDTYLADLAKKFNEPLDVEQ